MKKRILWHVVFIGSWLIIVGLLFAVLVKPQPQPTEPATTPTATSATTTLTLVYENSPLPEKVQMVINETTGKAYTPVEFTQRQDSSIIGEHFADFVSGNNTHTWAFYRTVEDSWPIKIGGNVFVLGQVTAVVYDSTSTSAILYVGALS